MGFYVSSAFSVSSNDKHSYFVYFIPGREPYDRLSTAWINSWVHEHFSEIAQSLGPTGVIVSPPPGTSWRDDERRLAGQIMDRSKFEDEFLHGHMPILLLSRIPLQPGLDEHKEGIAINLVKCADDGELAGVFDTIITGIREDNWQYIIDNYPLQVPAEEPDGYGGWLQMLNKVVELKPNVFGHGVNLNAALEVIGKKLLSFGQSRSLK